jgi:3,4-dihydroxy 2-butanone 4-phosphate synthase/GTP cyclohydrolase II
MATFDRIERAVADISAGKAVVVVDDRDRKNEGDLVSLPRRPPRD